MSVKEIKETKHQNELREYLQQILNKELPENLYESLQDGLTLLEMSNYFLESKITPQKPTNPFIKRDNVTTFIKNLRSEGLSESDLFVTEDLFEGRYLPVEICILAFLREMEKRGKNIPKNLFLEKNIPKPPTFIIHEKKPKDLNSAAKKQTSEKKKAGNTNFFYAAEETFKAPKVDIHGSIPRQINENYKQNMKSASKENVSVNSFFAQEKTFNAPKVDIHRSIPRQINENYKQNMRSNTEEDESKKFLYAEEESFSAPKVDIHAPLDRQIKGDFYNYSGPNKIVSSETLEKSQEEEKKSEGKSE